MALYKSNGKGNAFEQNFRKICRYENLVKKARGEFYSKQKIQKQFKH